MNRRELLGIAALTGIGISLGSKPLIAANSKLFPCRLKPGDKVGIIAPGSAVSDPMDLFRADEIIKALGLIAVYGRNVSKGSGYKTRTKEERIEDLHDMFSKNEIKAVFAIRGGYGTMDLLDAIEYDLIKENPKTFLGFSDITALHLAITQKSGLVTFHGPVMLSTFSEYSLQSLKKMLFEDTKDIFLMNPLRGDAIRNPYPVFTINEGKAEGELIGGNLSLISALMGTPYEIDTKNKILSRLPGRRGRSCRDARSLPHAGYIQGRPVQACCDTRLRYCYGLASKVAPTR